jgi:C-terminal binding protein
MLSLQFLSWAERAPAGERAEAAGNLARACLYAELDPIERGEMERAMTCLLDDASPLVRRQDVQTFGVLGLGRIGTAAALRARALGYRVVFHDPHLPNGADRALGIGRARTLDELLAQSDVLSIHAPLTRGTRNLIGERELRLLPRNAVVVNTARGPILDIDAVERCLRDGHLAGAGLDVVPEEPPRAPLPNLLRAYRAREDWTIGRVVVTPHIAFHTPEAWDDIRLKSAETMRDVLVEGLRTNVIPPESD